MPSFILKWGEKAGRPFPIEEVKIFHCQGLACGLQKACIGSIGLRCGFETTSGQFSQIHGEILILSQPQGMSPLHGCCGNPAWNQVGANWPHHIAYGQLNPFEVLWPFGHRNFSWPFMDTIIIYGLRPYPAITGLPGQFPYLQPTGLYL
ncbi:hypothetical protein O181_038030 [Austropuccinia psidii MF-1]|uniref:Uncharacterized protein n=1 Tax=Austropuccinia psidii MF-1 TaxID=1389203 RepID=A0A9Q3D966_9BASI|nr:hypothetical protein [Austropuccinia psidii MF-1]